MNKPLLLLTLSMACTGRDLAFEGTSSESGSVPQETSSDLPTTGDPWEIEPDPAFFGEGCASITSCECETPRFSSMEECQQKGAAAMVGAELEAKVLGLHFDRACFRDSDFFNRELRYGCMGFKEYHHTHPDDLWYPDYDSCGACVPGFGDRQLGESCTSYHTALSDCAQGLRCWESPELGTPICTDPCLRLGQPCGDDWFNPPCSGGADQNGSGWDYRFVCDEATHLCSGGVAGKPCINPDALGSANFCGGQNWELTCVNGLCQETPLPGKGEHCDFIRPCQKGMVCIFHGNATCEIPALEGDPCPFDEICDDYLVCQKGICVKGPKEGEPCTDDLQRPACGPYLDCMDGFCTPRPPVVCG